MNLTNTTINKFTLHHDRFQTNALCFIPASNDFNPKMLSIFTHGYTSSKHDLITWATRLSDAGITTTIFDLPGHYLGSYQEVDALEDFQLYSHELFGIAFQHTLEILEKHRLKLHDFSVSTPPLKLILGGHSLGALLALKSHCDSVFSSLDNITYFCVGLGLNPDVKVHLFDTDFYKKTLNIRKQLVSPHLDPKDIFPWIKNHKYNHDLKDKKIVLLCGQDDVVVGKGGAAYLKSLLEQHNSVELIEPARLPHHEPQIAAGYIFHYLKKFL